jgi:hypothetical protein
MNRISQAMAELPTGIDRISPQAAIKHTGKIIYIGIA